jgi:O-antigen/teichoic acid export membrane protein
LNSRFFAQSIFLRFERRYIVCASIVFALAIAIAIPAGAMLLRDGDRFPTDVVLLTSLMSVAQIVGGLYRSVLIGLGRQVRFNVLLVSFTGARHFAGVAAAFWFHTVSSVATCFLSVSLLELIARRRAAVRVISSLPHRERAQTDSLEGMTLAIGATTLAIAGAVGALSTQLDRLLLAGFLGAVELGHYAIAASLSLAVLQLVYPVSSALLPKLILFKDSKQRGNILFVTYGAMLSLLLVMWTGAIILSSGALHAWLPSVGIADSVARLFFPHLVGTSFNALCVPLYMGLLANQLDRGILIANSFALTFQVVVLVAAVPQYGAIGGAYAWIASNAVLLSTFLFLHCRMVRSAHE